MVVNNPQSNRSSVPLSLDLPFDHFSISSAREHLGVMDGNTPLYVHFPVELQQAQRSPFHEWYVRDVACANHGCTCEAVRGTGDCLDCSPTSPIKNPSCSQGGTWPSPSSKRESLLQDAWQRKQELYLKQELVDVEKCLNVRPLGRSSSDCGNHIMDCFRQTKHDLLERSMSDCGRTKKDPLVNPNWLSRTQTRSLTDDDFEELKGCLDLGFRFDHSSISDLCDTIPALEVVSAVNQNFQVSLIASTAQGSAPSPSLSWRITKPGDDPDVVRGKLRQWAQAVACSARLCY